MRKAILFSCILLLSILYACASVSSANSFFETDIVSIEELQQNPTRYDSTTAYRKISIVSTINDMGTHSVSVGDESYSLKLDPTKRDMFLGFEKGDEVKMTGHFIHRPLDEDMFLPEYVMHHPVEHVGDVQIKDIMKHPENFNGKYLRIKGNLTDIREYSTNYIIHITDTESEGRIKVIFYGVTILESGTLVEAEGLFNENTLHSEKVKKYRDPLSINTVLPGFSSLAGIVALALSGIALMLKKHRD